MARGMRAGSAATTNLSDWRPTIKRLRAEIARHKTIVATTPDHHERVAALQSILKTMDQFSANLRDPPRALSGFMRDGSLQVLGELMSPMGINRYCPGAIRIDERMIADNRMARDLVIAQDELTRQGRMNMAAQIGPRLLAEVIDAVAAPLRGQLRLERSHRGGRPQDLYRNYVVQELAYEYAARIGRPVPSAKNGPFIELCNAVLIELEQNTEPGLAECVRRITRRVNEATGVQNPS